MQKDILVYIEDILESIQKIEEYTNTLTKDKFSHTISIQDAVLMRLAVIGESTHKLPNEIRDQYSAVPWRKIINLRNIIVHDYSSINIDRIWIIIQKDLPEFKKYIQKLLQQAS